MSVFASFNRVDNAAGTPAEAIEAGPSAAARVVSAAARVTVYPLVAVGSRAMRLPWPFFLLDHAAGLLPAPPGIRRDPVELPRAYAELVHAREVACHTGRVVLYCHGGGFLSCGINTHLRLVERLSSFADAPILVVAYRKLPRHRIRDAIDDCRDAYSWLRENGYRADQVVIAGDSAGGYLALTLAQELLRDGERPAALTLLSPLLQLRSSRPRGRGAMLPHRAFHALSDLIAAREGILYEPLDHIEPGLPPTLIHVSRAEELVYDAQVALQRLAEAGVPVEARIWPDQIHVFQMAVPLVPEAVRSLRQIGDFIRAVTNWTGAAIPSS